MRYRRSSIVSGLLVGGLLLGGGLACFERSAEAETDAEARALMAQVAGDYTDWPRMPGFEYTRPSEAPHGLEVDIYINATLDEAVRGGAEPPWPVGSLAVKRGYVDEVPWLTAIMERRADGWFFAQFTADGRLLTAGTDVMCQDCHGPEHGGLLSAVR